MHNIILVVIMLIGFSISAEATDWWIVDINNQIVAKCDYRPDEADLESRNEIAIPATEDISFAEAEFRGNRIVKHVETESEKKIKEDKNKHYLETQMIEKRMKKIAMDELKSEGVEFEYIDE